MTEGKSAAAISAVSFQDWLSLRQLGHLGCSLEHYAWDRAGLTALERLSRQWHKQQELPVLPDDLAPEVLRLTEFVVVTPLSPPRRPERVQVGNARGLLRWRLDAGRVCRCREPAQQRRRDRQEHLRVGGRQTSLRLAEDRRMGG